MSWREQQFESDRAALFRQVPWARRPINGRGRWRLPPAPAVSSMRRYFWRDVPSGVRRQLVDYVRRRPNSLGALALRSVPPENFVPFARRRRRAVRFLTPFGVRDPAEAQATMRGIMDNGRDLPMPARIVQQYRSLAEAAVLGRRYPRLSPTWRDYYSYRPR